MPAQLRWTFATALQLVTRLRSTHVPGSAGLQHPELEPHLRECLASGGLAYCELHNRYIPVKCCKARTGPTRYHNPHIAYQDFHHSTPPPQVAPIHKSCFDTRMTDRRRIARIFLRLNSTPHTPAALQSAMTSHSARASTITRAQQHSPTIPTSATAPAPPSTTKHS